MNDCRKCLNYKAFSEVCSLNIASQEEIKSNPISTCLSFNAESNLAKSFTFELTDDEGMHILQSDRDCIWKCKYCKKEVEVTEDSVKGLDEKMNLPKCPDCGNYMKLHYWLDCQD